MKNRREMTAMEHMTILERQGLIKIMENTIIVKTWARDDDGEVEQVVKDYMAYAAKHGYNIKW